MPTVLHVTASTILKEKIQIHKLYAPLRREILQISEKRKTHCFIKIKRLGVRQLTNQRGSRNREKEYEDLIKTN